jgi:hypothetical protein
MPCVVVELKVLWVGLEVEGFWRIEEYEVRERLNLEVWWTRGRAVMIVAMQGCLVQTHRTRIEISKSLGSQVEVARNRFPAILRKRESSKIGSLVARKSCARS